MTNSETAETIRRLYNRTVILLHSLQGQPRRRRNLDAARRYNTLRADVKQLVNDPNFERSVPPAWYLKPLYILIGILFLAIIAGLSYLLTEQLVVPMIVAGLFLAVLMIIVMPSSSSESWRVASTTEQVADRVTMLYHYLRDHIGYSHPYLALPHDGTNGENQLKRKLSDLQAHNRALEQELSEAKLEIGCLKERLTGLETPSNFEIPQNVFDKLDQLERTRLLEAVQAYRVNAWTPSAAVCGMILEGRLQRLCRENDISPGGIGEMIQRLGESGLLKGYYQNLARVGEFFRHRASHPTSEEFDREKTILVLTSLVILIRDSF